MENYLKLAGRGSAFYLQKKEEEEEMNELGKEALEELNNGKGEDTPEGVE